MKKSIAVDVLLFGLILSACSSFRQATPAAFPTLTLTAGPAPISTPVPINTPLPPTVTLEPAAGVAPEGHPASEWKGIPIMPDAITGEGDDESYVFTVKATPEQIEGYYQLELGKLGWRSLSKGNSDSSLMLIFTNNDSATLTVSIITKGDEALVLLVK